MSSPPTATALTPPGVSRVFFSFTHARGQTDRTARVRSSAPSLDFDAGINASAAWTEHLDSDSAHHSLSDDEGNDSPDEGNDGRQGRVLFNFEGKAEFRELDVKAGDDIEVVREEVGDGWSVVKTLGGEMGLLPRTYYTFTIDFLSAPPGGAPPRGQRASSSRRDASAASLTPRASPTRISAPLPAQPIIVQTTGERMMAAFPSFRQNLLGGKSLNRFSSFVTSGAEAYVLTGATEPSDAPPLALKHTFEPSEDEEEAAHVDIPKSAAEKRVRARPSEADRHFVDAGPAWRSKVPPFRILVHSPSKRASTLSGAYTVYGVTSLFHPPSDSDSDSSDNESDPASRITVQRRFSHFVVLHTALTRRLPGIALPPLPEKQYAGRFNDDFVEARRGDLERYLTKIVRHPIARYAEILMFFLGCESDTEWKRQLPNHLALPPAGPSFYANVYHPDFNIDAEDAAESIDRFESHTKAVGAGVQGLRNTFGQIRQARIEMSKAERTLSYSLLSLITTKPIATVPSLGVTIREDELYYESDAESDNESDNAEDKPLVTKNKGYVNEEGAWCWREGCEECLRMTKALQKTSETLQSVADLYDDHARRTQLATHEALKSAAHPSQLYAPIVDTHRNALSRYTQATQGDTDDEEIASRCETVLNTTMAEMETYHTQKVEDFTSIAKEHLDGEIEFYEQVLSRLRTARRTFEAPIYPALSTGARQASIYERELEHPRLNPDPLPQPCPHVFDSAPMRPVSQAIQDGVGMLIGGATNVVAGRGSVFGRFW